MYYLMPRTYSRKSYIEHISIISERFSSFVYHPYLCAFCGNSRSVLFFYIFAYAQLVPVIPRIDWSFYITQIKVKPYSDLLCRRSANQCISHYKRMLFFVFTISAKFEISDIAFRSSAKRIYGNNTWYFISRRMYQMRVGIYIHCKFLICSLQLIYY